MKAIFHGTLMDNSNTDQFKSEHKKLLISSNVSFNEDTMFQALFPARAYQRVRLESSKCNKGTGPITTF